MGLKFTIEKKIKGGLGRAGKIETEHGVINTPAFMVVGTKSTVKALTPEMLIDLGAEAVLANTYHLYLQPGDKILKEAGGIQKFMNWNGPTMTDSGGFQVFSLGVAWNSGIGKVLKSSELNRNEVSKVNQKPLAVIDEDGVSFKSIIDGSTHRLNAEKSMEIQHNIGADIMFAFDECTSPMADYDYQKEAMGRTHRWAIRSLQYHVSHNTKNQSLFGVVQGGRFEDLRKESAEFLAKMDFDGYGIGGSFDKEDMYKAVSWVNKILPEEKPRHLLGIGEPLDIFGGVESGADTFDCVAPTRMARHGSLYTSTGRVNILNSRFIKHFQAIDDDCACYTCRNYTCAYLSHLYRSKEMLGATLGSIHNIFFIVNLLKKIRISILNDTFYSFKEEFINKYYKGE
jgi:queuine tRNA-ribosyltransferase